MKPLGNGYMYKIIKKLLTRQHGSCWTYRIHTNHDNSKMTSRLKKSSIYGTSDIVVLLSVYVTHIKKCYEYNLIAPFI